MSERETSSEKALKEFWDVDRLTEFDSALISGYIREQVPVDSLPYTDHFDRIYESQQKMGDNRSKNELFRRLASLRKSGRLPRLDAKAAG